MASIHQLRCFLAVLERGSFTSAATELGYAQPSVSEQVRKLEESLGTPLLHRLGRGVRPTEAGLAVRPHAEQVLRALDDARQAALAVRDVVTGTVRFGMFGTARVYFGGELVAALLERHPDVRVELIGQNSTEVVAAIRRGTLEAGVVGLPIDDHGLVVTPLITDELVYVSAHPERLGAAVDAAALAAAPLVLSDASWGNEDSTRRQLARMVQDIGGTLQPRVEVEDVETALEVAGRGHADAVIARGVLHRLADRVPAHLGWAPLDPPLADTFAIAHRQGATMSRATQVVAELVREHMEELEALVGSRAIDDARSRSKT
jgi:DNA-binding transcriptional LysR family regulator